MIDKNVLLEVIDAALSEGGDYAEVFVEKSYLNSIKMIGGDIEEAKSGADYGLGLRIFDGFNGIYAYTNNTDRNNLLKVARNTSKALKSERIMSPDNLEPVREMNNHLIKIRPDRVNQSDKLDLMKRANQVASNYDETIKQTVINYFDKNQEITFINSEGDHVQDDRVRTRLAISAVASIGGEKQTGFYAPGAHMGFEFYDTIDIEEYAEEAARIAATMIKADYAPAGKMPVVIDNGFGGVIFHEACGHSLEATSVAKKTSVFADRVGEQIASKVVTAIDDGTIPNAWGSQNFDDEGIPMQKNVLIKDGILQGYLVDRLNGRRMNAEPTGSGRRESYKYAPTSRMTNTYIAPGQSSKEEIINSVDYGLYASKMGGGSVDPSTGQFNFNVQEGYLIRDGKIAEPVRGATLIGKGEDILKKIDMVGDNLAHEQGMCGSISGAVPANVGQPMIRVSELTVGGREGGQS
ncbi:MAG: TldD/PmbA family protein [Bacillota bacterium]